MPYQYYEISGTVYRSNPQDMSQPDTPILRFTDDVTECEIVRIVRFLNMMEE